MKIEVVREKMLEAVGFAEKIAGKHVSLPVLSMVVIDATNEQIIIKATNLDIGIELNVSGKINEPGVVAISGSILRSFLSNSNDKNISLYTDGGFLVAESDNSSVKIKTVSTEDFPAIPIVSDGNELTIGSNDLVNIVKSVGYSASTSTIKPELSSIYIIFTQDELIAVATDSFRLAEKRIKIKKRGDMEDILIPYKNFIEIARVFDSIKTDVKIKSNKNQASFFADGIHITSRAVDGNFPDYKQIIPKEFVSKANILTEDLLRAVKLLDVFADNFKQVVLTIAPSKKTVILETKNGELGEGRHIIKANCEGSDLSIAFNLKYLFDCLMSIPSETASLNFSGENKPALIKESGNQGLTYLIMPMSRS